MYILPVILSGGSGSRLWPSSRTLYPKQLLPLISERSMLQETLLRLQGAQNLLKPLVICNHEHRFIIAEQLASISVEATLILEPEGKNTAPAATIAALYAQQHYPDAILLILPADHFIRTPTAFHNAITAASNLATQDYLVTFGITPTAPETGYGYIQQGEAISDQAYQVKRFVEKPSEALAKEYLAEGNYLWNSGMFVFAAKTYLEEIMRFAPAIHQRCSEAFMQAKIDPDFIRLGTETFKLCPEDSIDYAVMERTSRAAVLQFNTQWSDVGSWSSLWELLPKDQNQNVIQGDVLTHLVSNCYIHAQDRLLAAVGVDNLVIVEQGDAILVANKDCAQEVKTIVKRLKEHQRSEHESHHVVHRPWGTYETLDLGKRYQVKRITVKPHARLSLQLHHHRAEHWIVVKGIATVTCGDAVFDLHENQSTYIPIETKHRLENKTEKLVELIEVQSGGYLGEDDIVRFDDDYQRTVS